MHFQRTAFPDSELIAHLNTKISNILYPTSFKHLTLDDISELPSSAKVNRVGTYVGAHLIDYILISMLLCKNFWCDDTSRHGTTFFHVYY